MLVTFFGPLTGRENCNIGRKLTVSIFSISCRCKQKPCLKRIVVSNKARAFIIYTVTFYRIILKNS